MAASKPAATHPVTNSATSAVKKEKLLPLTDERLAKTK
jgi:hypothetical protein